MNHPIKIILRVVLLSISLSGCTGLDRVMMDSDPAASVRYVRENDLGYDSMKPEHQIRVCEGYLSLNLFQDFQTCLTSFRNKIPYPRLVVWQSGSFGASSRETNRDYAIAYVRGMQAQAALEVGDYSQARIYGREAYQAVMGEPSIYSNNAFSGLYRDTLLPRIAGVMALLEAREGNRNAAKPYIKQIAAIETGSYMTTFLEPVKQSWLGKNYLAINEPEKALEALTNSDLSAGGVVLKTLLYANYVNPAYYVAGATSGLNLGDLTSARDLEKNVMICRALFQMSKLTEAEDCYGKLSETELLDSFGSLKFRTLVDLGEIASRHENYKIASQYFAKAIDLLEEQRSSIALDGQKMGFMSDRMQVYSSMINALIKQGKNRQAFEVVERAKSRALVDLLSSKKEFGHRETPGQQQLIADIDQLSQSALSSPRLKGSRSVRGLKRKIQLKAPKLSSLTTVQIRDYDSLIAPLQQGETLLEYYTSEEQGYIFVVSRKQLRVTTFDIKGLKQDILEFRRNIQDPGSAAYETQAKKLYSRLIAPVAGIIDTDSLVIVPHGNLHYLPFAALTDGQEFIIERHAIRILPSSSVMSLIEKRNVTKQARSLVLGNPDLHNPEWDLPAAEREAKALGQTLSAPKILLREQASETAVKNLGQAADILHIASHGQFDPQAPLNSRLLLAGDNQNDGYLTAGEIFELPLNASLVTLSACETGLGQISTGDEVIGFTRGFLYAGASSIVTSLWVVDDEATEKLMSAFYQKLQQQRLPEALRQAQLKVMEQKPHPFYWAAFQLSGQS